MKPFKYIIEKSNISNNTATYFSLLFDSLLKDCLEALRGKSCFLKTKISGYHVSDLVWTKVSLNSFLKNEIFLLFNRPNSISII